MSGTILLIFQVTSGLFFVEGKVFLLEVSIMKFVNNKKE